MSSQVEIWFEIRPSNSALAEALVRFGTLHSMSDGLLRLVESDEAPIEGVPFQLLEDASPPLAVKHFAPRACAVMRASAVLSGSRGFWMVRMAARVQRELGGIIYLPPSEEAFVDAASFETSWPSEHGGHGGGHGQHDH